MDSFHSMNLSRKSIKALLKAFQPRVREFKKGEIILRRGTKENHLCLLLKGTAYLCIENEYEAKQLLDFFTEGQFLCYEMLPTPHNGHSYIHAKYPCSIAYLDYRELIEYNRQDADNEIARIADVLFLSIISARNEHCHMLQQKSIRSKLLAFFHYQSLLQDSLYIHIPIPYSDLADYLTIDRSALMTQLSRMEKEGIIEKRAHDIRLIS